MSISFIFEASPSVGVMRTRPLTTVATLGTRTVDPCQAESSVKIFSLESGVKLAHTALHSASTYGIAQEVVEMHFRIVDQFFHPRDQP